MRLRSAVVAFSSVLLAWAPQVWAQDGSVPVQSDKWIMDAARAVQSDMVTWRRYIHKNPELGNQEVATATYVIKELAQLDESLGLNLTFYPGIAKTGVVAVLRGGLPGPVVALRADMDALPVKEETGLSFASEAKGIYLGKEEDVMHACGHDVHTAMLMGALTVLAENRDKVSGTVVFIFQPAEEGPADTDIFGEKPQAWGARRMVDEGVLTDFGNVEAIFGMHVVSQAHKNTILYKAGPILSSADSFRITLTGEQTHGAMPWDGADPIAASAQVINAIQTLVSRRADLTQGMGVVSIGSIHSGDAVNIVPDELVMEGTIRSSADPIRSTLTEELPALVEQSAAAHNVTADVRIVPMMPITHNDEELTAAMLPALRRAAGGNVGALATSQAPSEDFSYYTQAKDEDDSAGAKKVSGLFVFLGAARADQDVNTAPRNHSPAFDVDEATMETGVRAHVEFVLSYAQWQAGL